MKIEPKLFVATKAFIVKDGKVLVVKESTKYSDGSNAGKFDVVGGRLKPGERYDESLKREVREETGLEIKIGRPFFVTEWRPTVRGEPWQIVAVFFECMPSSETITLGDDHSEYAWVDPRDYKNHDLIDNLHSVFEAYTAHN